MKLTQTPFFDFICDINSFLHLTPLAAASETSPAQGPLWAMLAKLVKF